MKSISEKISLTVVFLLFCGMTAQVFSDSVAAKKEFSFKDRRPNVEPVSDRLYLQECSDCHIAYSRGFLPMRSWEQLLSPAGLTDHFGEYLAIEEGDRRAIEEYLKLGAVERAGGYYLSRKIRPYLGANETPLKISQLGYIRNKHRDIPDKYITGNGKVLSISQCNACHQRAEQGIFVKGEIYIPYASRPGGETQ